MATVLEIGKQRKIEQPTGRKAQLLPGDEIIVAYGSRYAPDQFEAHISEDLGVCNLVAAGGLASREVCRHDKMLPATKIMPIGLLGDNDGRTLNLQNYRVSREPSERPIKLVVVVGTAMNSGKTFTAASIIYSLKSTSYRVAGIKATGTGAGGDYFLYRDMGADVSLDMTDGGFPGTYLLPDVEIEKTVHSLIQEAARQECDIVVMEIADGLRHVETATLLQSPALKAKVSGVVFAAYDSMGAKAGIDMLHDWGYDVLAISGQLTRSPLAMRETAGAVSVPILTPFEIQYGALLSTIIGNEKLNGNAKDTNGFLVNHGAVINQFPQLTVPSLAHAQGASTTSQYRDHHFFSGEDMEDLMDDDNLHEVIHHQVLGPRQ